MSINVLNWREQKQTQKNRLFIIEGLCLCVLISIFFIYCSDKFSKKILSEQASYRVMTNKNTALQQQLMRGMPQQDFQRIKNDYVKLQDTSRQQAHCLLTLLGSLQTTLPSSGFLTKILVEEKQNLLTSGTPDNPNQLNHVVLTGLLQTEPSQQNPITLTALWQALSRHFRRVSLSDLTRRPAGDTEFTLTLSGEKLA